MILVLLKKHLRLYFLYIKNVVFFTNENIINIFINLTVNKFFFDIKLYVDKFDGSFFREQYVTLDSLYLNLKRVIINSFRQNKTFGKHIGPN